MIGIPYEVPRGNLDRPAAADGAVRPAIAQTARVFITMSDSEFTTERGTLTKIMQSLGMGPVVKQVRSSYEAVMLLLRENCGDGYTLLPCALITRHGETRGRARSAMVNMTLLNELQEAMGKLDGERERKADDEVKIQETRAGVEDSNGEVETKDDGGEPDGNRKERRRKKVKPLIWTVNPWAIDSNYNTRNFQYSSDQGGCWLDGTFKINGENKLMVGYYPWYRGGDVVAYSTDYTVYGVRENVGARPQITDNQNLGNASDRLKFSVLSVLNFVNFGDKFDIVNLSKRIKSHYTRLNKYYSTLEADIDSILLTRWFLDELNARYANHYRDYVMRLELRLRSKLVMEGRDLSWELFLHKWVMRLRVLTPLAGCAYLWAQATSSLIPGAIILGLGELAVQLFANPKRVMRNMASWEFPQLKNPGLIPCASLGIHTSIIDPDRLDTVIADGINFETKYDITPSEDYVPKVVDIYGTTIPSASMVYPDTGPQNLEGALRYRMMHDREIDRTFLRGFVAYARKKIDAMDKIDVHVDREENIRHLVSTYGTTRAEQLIPLIDEQLTTDHFMYQLFVKREAYVGKDEDNFKPRMIWSCPDIIIAKFSCMFSKISKALRELYDGVGNDYYVCGSTPDEVGARVDAADSIAGFKYESDVKSWDGSLENEVLSLEKYFMEVVLENTPMEFSLVIENWDQVMGTNRDRTVTITMTRGRRSGDLATSSFNSFVNIWITRYIFEHFTNVTCVVVNGDDNITFTETYVDPAEIVGLYKKGGFDCVVHHRKTLDELTFCSGYFPPVDGLIRWGNSAFKVLMKLGLNHGNHPKRKWQGLLYGTAKGLLCTTGHVPIIGALCRAIVNSSEARGVKALTDNRWENPYRIQGGTVLTPAEDTYRHFAWKYHYDVDYIKALDVWIEDNVDIIDFPMKLTGEVFTYGAALDVGLSGAMNLIEGARPEVRLTFENQQLSELWSYQWDDIVVTIPMNEEKHKLEGAQTLSEALENARLFGLQENEIYHTTGHEHMHQLFTALSWFNLDWGIGAHSLYNQFALMTSGKPCAKKKQNNNKKRPSQPRPKPKKDFFTRRENPVIASGMRAGGAYLGNMIFPGIGGAIGGLIGAGVSKISGFGDYKVQSNTLLNAPVFKGKQSIRLRNREYIGDITGSTGFSLTSYHLNPGNRVLCPWLAGIAQGYQQYIFKGVVLTFQSTSADALNSTNTALGVVMLATNYDMNEPNFSTKAELMASYFCSIGSPSTTIMHAIECNPRERPINVLNIDHIGEGNDEPGMHDHGNFQVATSGMQAAANIGQLWISYDVELIKPRFSSFSQAMTYYSATGWDATNHFGASIGTAAGTPVTMTANTIVLSGWRGRSIEIIVSWHGSATITWSAIPSHTLTNCTSVLAFNNNTSNVGLAANSTTRAGINVTCTVSEDHTLTPYITLANNYSSGGTPGYMQFHIFELRPSTCGL